MEAASVTSTDLAPRHRDQVGSFWEYFSDPDALVAGLAPKMPALMQSRGMEELLTSRDRLRRSQEGEVSASMFVTYLQTSSPSVAVFEALVAWMRSDAGKLGYLCRERNGGGNSNANWGATVPDASLFDNPGICEGREEVIEHAVAVLCQEPGSSRRTAVFLRGMGGIGKSTVALKVLAHAEVFAHFGERRFFVRCDKVASAEALEGNLARELCITPSTGQTTKDAIILFLCSAPAIVVLDNFEDIFYTENRVHLRGFLSWIVGNCSLVLTYRGKLDIPISARYVALDINILNEAAARSAFLLWAEISELDVGSTSLDDLLSKLDGYPLAISIVAKLTRYQTIAEISRRYTIRMTTLSEENGEGRLENLHISVELSLNSRLMENTRGAKPLCHLLSMLPDGADHDLVQLAISGSTDDSGCALRAATAVIQSGLASRDASTGLLRMLVPLRDYFATRTDLVVHWETSSPATVARYFFNFVAKAKMLDNDPIRAANENVSSLITNQFQNINTTIETALRLPDLRQDAASAAVDLVRHATWNTFTIPPCISKAIILAQELGWMPVFAEALAELARLLYGDYRMDEAQRRFEESLACYRQLEDRIGQAYCLRLLGKIASYQGRHSDVTRLVDQALDLYRQTSDLKGEAQCLRTLAMSAIAQGQFTNALGLLDSSLNLSRNTKYVANEAYCLLSLGDLLIQQDRYEDSSRFLHEALVLHRLMKDLQGEATLIALLGKLSLCQNKLSDAALHLREALGLARRINDRWTQSKCIGNLGAIALEENRLDDAKSLLEQGLALSRELGDSVTERNCLQCLGVMAFLDARWADATSFFTQCLTIGLKIMASDRYCKSMLAKIKIREIAADAATRQGRDANRYPGESSKSNLQAQPGDQSKMDISEG